MSLKSGDTKGNRRVEKARKEGPGKAKPPMSAPEEKAAAYRKKTQTHLTEAPDLFETLTDNMLDGLVVIDWGGNILFANKAVYRIAGMRPRKDPKGLTMAQFLHPEDLERAMENHMLVKEGKAGVFAQYRVVSKQKEPRWIETIGQKVLFNGQEADLVTIRDITDRKRIEVQLQLSEKKFFTAFHDNPDPVMISVSATGVIIDTNRAFETWSGYRRDELVGKTANEMGIWADPGERERLFGILSAGKPVKGFPARLKQRDGQIRDMLFSANPIVIEGKEYAISIARDITDLKQAEQALRESEERFRYLHEASFGGIGIHDKGIILDCNQGLAAISGYSTDELIGMNGLDLIAPDWRDHVMQNIMSGYEQPYDVEGIRKDRTIYPLEIQGKNIRYHGKIVRVTEFRDITARKMAEDALRESEERYRKIASAVTDYIYTVHIEGGKPVMTDHSPACEAVTGYTVEEFNADPFLWFTMVVEEDRRRVLEYFSRVILDEHEGPIEHRIHHKDGSLRWVANMPVVHRNETGDIISYDGVLSDITKRKQADEAIRQRQAKLDSIFRVAPTGIGVVTDRVLQEVNERICTMTGYAREELVGKPARILYPTQEDHDYVGTEKYRQISEKGTGTVETRWKRKDGAIIDILLSSTPIVPGDLSAGVTFTALDITDRKRSEEALRESRQMLRLVLDTIPVRVFWKDKDSRYMGCNTQFAKDAGLASTEEVIGRDDFSLSWSDQTELYREYDRSVISTGESKLNYVQPETRADGSQVWLRTSKVPLLDAGGEVEGVLGIYEDITESKRSEEALKESEERYRLMAELTGKVVYDYDVSTGRITWHGAISQLTGYTPGEFDTIDFKRFNAMIHPEDRAGTMSTLDAALGECGGYTAEYRLRRKDGAYIYVEDHGVFLCGDGLGATRMLGSFGDITKRKKAEEAMRESEERYHSLFDNSHAVMLLINPDTGSIVDANHAACIYYGYTKQELTVKNISEINTLDPEDILKEMQRAKEHDQRSFFFRHRLSDGDIRDVEVFSGPVRISGQTLLCSIVHDTTERKKAEAALRDSEERFRGITNNLPGGVFQFYARKNGEMGLYYVSDFATELLGLGTDPQKVYNKFIKGIAEEDRERFLASIVEAVRTVSRWDCEARFIRPTGQEMYIRGISQPTPLADEIIFNGVLLDITDRRRAEDALKENEERFRSLIQSSLDIIVILDENGLITYESPSMEQVLKYPPGEMIGNNPLDFIHPEDVETVVSALGEVFEDVNRGIPTEFRFKRADGIWIYLEAIGNNLIDYPGINGVVITARDITERKRSEEERIDMERRMLHAQKLESLGVMAGGIAHDFNNLLMAILGNLDLARIDLSPVSRSRPFIDQALVAARRAADLTNQMLAYSGKGRFDLKPFDLSELVQEMAHLLKASISKTVTLNLQMDSGLPSIIADPSQIQQIIMNLIVNASEAIGEHPGVVTITTGALVCDEDYLQASRLKEKPAPGVFVFFEVRDTGCGMDEETKDRLFDPFFTTKFTGRGLGMAAVLGIVSGHKGAIMVESEPGEGTALRVLFPAMDGRKALKSDKQAASADDSRAEETAPTPGAVLIADDDEMVLNLCKTMVERIGYKVLVASDGDEAVKIFRERETEIVCAILDLSMPKLDGMATFDELRRIRPDIKVILSSGYDEQETTQRFLGRGLAGFIKKPYQLSSLRGELMRVIRETL